MITIEHGFERQLLSLCFSKSDGGKKLVAVDDSTDHTLTVWDWEKPDGGDAEKLCSDTPAGGYAPLHDIYPATR